MCKKAIYKIYVIPKNETKNVLSVIVKDKFGPQERQTKFDTTREGHNYTHV